MPSKAPPWQISGDIRRIDLDELLVRVLAAALRRHGSRRALEDLQERLLDTLARHVARDGRVLGLARNLIDLVDVDDAALSLLDVVVRRLDELQQDILNVFADVAGFRQGRRIGDGKRHIEDACERLREQRLAAARRADHEDVRLCEFHILTSLALPHVDALIVVVDRPRTRSSWLRRPMTYWSGIARMSFGLGRPWARPRRVAEFLFDALQSSMHSSQM